MAFAPASDPLGLSLESAERSRAMCYQTLKDSQRLGVRTSHSPPELTLSESCRLCRVSVLGKHRVRPNRQEGEGPFGRVLLGG